MAHIMDTGTVIAFDQRAVQTVQRMGDYVARLRSFYGEDSVEHRQAAASLAHSLQAMIGLGGRVSQDGELGLYGVSLIHYGVVFHSRGVPEAYTGIDGAPQPGEWSVHS